MTTEVKSSEEIQRIYIGGLDPDRLPAQQIVERLKQTEGIHVDSLDYKPTDTYMFINAVAKNKKKDEEEGLDLTSNNHHKRPLEIITAMYNNVRWKGCRLKVEAAKPHFLQILANEIQQRNNNKQQQQQQLSMNSERSSTSNSNKIPRHLRIRRRRGDEVTKIDTKPQTIQIPCHELITHNKNNIIPKRKKFSRAVHIIFLDDDNSTPSAPKAIDNTSCTAVHNEDSENTSSPTEDDNDDVTIASQTSTDTTNSDSDEKSLQQKLQQIGGSGKYQWSDDSDSSSSNIFNKSDHDEHSNNQDNHGNNIMDEKDINLSNDVSLNMNIFAQLFPDAAQLKQKQKIEYQKKEKVDDPHVEKHLKDTVIPRYDPTSASAKTFEIQKDSKTEEVASLLMNQEEKEDSKSHKLLNDNDTLTIEKPNSSMIQPHNIYEEKKLETVFQENSLKAKNGQGFRLFDDESLNAEKPVGLAASESNQQANIYQEKKLETIFQEPALKSKNRQGFHLFGKDESSLRNEGKPAGFSFAFTPDEESSNRMVGSSLVPATSSMAEVLSVDGGPAAEELQTMSTATINKRRWHGFSFPQNILNDWEDEFFALNGGVEIDEDANDEWEEKRVALTLDWRRKYKHAMERLSTSKRRKRA